MSDKQDQLPPGPYRKEMTEHGAILVVSESETIAYCPHERTADLFIDARAERDETLLTTEWLMERATHVEGYGDFTTLTFGESLVVEFLEGGRLEWWCGTKIVPDWLSPKTRGDFFTRCRQLKIELKQRKADA